MQPIEMYNLLVDHLDSAMYYLNHLEKLGYMVYFDTFTNYSNGNHGYELTVKKEVRVTEVLGNPVG